MDPKKEETILQLWKAKQIYEKAKKLGRGRKKFYFLDGPPYATGSIHLGTAWNKILKGIYIRFWSMQGFDVHDQPGYDTHGLPIENKIEKELQIKSKADIERIGIEKFVLACRDYATRFIGTMSNQFANLGVWMDWEHPYVTLDNEYIEGAWHAFKIAYDSGFLYRGLYPVHVCPHCETAVAYNEIEYTKVTDPSIFVKFRIREEEGAGKSEEAREVSGPTIPAYLLIWTTTPWTLPANTGVMAKPDADYVYVKVDDQIWLIAKELLETLMQKLGSIEYKILKTVKGKDLEGLRYTHPLSDMLEYQRTLKGAHRIVLSDQYVTLDTGTGLVHTAPGHGQEDYKVGLENKLPTLSPVNMNGTFTEETGELAGIFVKHADRIIIDKLKERGLLVLEEKINHDYPQCWRCNSPLLLISVPQWFFRVTKIRNKLLIENKKVNWYPKWAGQRFDNWLENLGDWPISRQRYWGIPLPIWICQNCNYVKVVGSVKELKTKLKDLHRPYIDSVILKCGKCRSGMKRIPDVLDVWFDSGLASWASLGYPKNKKLFREMWPAQLNIEGPDQIRGWWNSQLITSVITFGKAPFKNILFHGFVLDAHGNKMAKSLGNIVAPEEVVQKYGRDVLRYYLISSPPWDDFYFKWVDVDAVAKSFTIIENTFNFVATYVAKQPKKTAKLMPEDGWVISRLNSTVESATTNMQNCNVHKAATDVHNFIVNDFSRWYIKLVRDRVWPAYEGKDKAAALYTLSYVARMSAQLLSIFCPFISEHAWQSVCRPLGSKEESVHLTEWPKAGKKFIDRKMEESMSIVKEINEAASALRKEHQLKLRWPIEKIVVESKDAAVKNAVKEFGEVLKFAANSKKIETGYGDDSLAVKEFSKGKVYVSKKILKDEALLRELLREIQEQRKKRKLVVKQKIILYIDNEKMKQFSKEIKEKVGAKEIHFETIAHEFGSVSVDNEKVGFKFTLAK